MALYNADGKIRINIVSGTVSTGLYAPDGAYNGVLDVTPNVSKGLYHPCGAYNVTLAVDGDSSRQAPNGSYRVINTGGNYTMYNPLSSVVVTPPGPLPTVSSISPTSGNISGGTAVTITGTDLTGATSVTFGGVSATSVTVVNNTTITATTPSGTAGARSVIVTTPNGSNSSNTLFTYSAAPTYVTETVQSLPAMTSNTAPAGHVVSASGTFNDPNIAVWRAFDQVINGNRWSSAGTANQWIKRKTPNPIQVGGYRVTSGYLSQQPIGWVFAGSNDDSTWTTLDTQSNLSWGSSETKSFIVPEVNRNSYLYHRLFFAATSYDTIFEIELLQDIAQ